MFTLTVVVDGRTGRFLKLCQSAQLTEELPKTSARRLVGMARAVRLLAEAGESDLARHVVIDMEKLVVEAREDGLQESWLVSFQRHCLSVRSALSLGELGQSSVPATLTPSDQGPSQKKEDSHA
jgi:hypothetical protein